MSRNTTILAVFSDSSGALWITSYAVPILRTIGVTHSPAPFALGVLHMFRTGFHSADFSAARPAIRMGALSLAAVLVLGGCSGSGDDPGAEAAAGSSSSASPSSSSSAGGDGTVSASATPTATPTHTAAYKPATAEGPAENVPLPVMPELAKQESKEGLREFSRYWYALLNYAFDTGNVQQLQQISAPECVLCKRAYEMLAIGYENDDWIVGGDFVVLGTQSNFILTSKGQYQVLVHLEQHPLEYRGPGGQVYETDEGLDSNSVHMIEASYSEGSWFAHNAVIIR